MKPFPYQSKKLPSALAGVALSIVVPVGFAADVEIFTDEEKFVISDRVMSLHMIYHTMNDTDFTRKLQGENLTIAEWAKKAGVGSMRFPGGTTTKSWDWQNPSNSFTGDPWAPNYSGPEGPNSKSMSLDEYLAFVQQAGIQPHIGINNYSATKYNRLQDSIDRAVAQVQYIVDAGYPGLVYYIGNEEDHGQGGPVGAAHIDKLHAQAIKAVDPTCKIIWNSNGASGPIVRRMLELNEGWLDGVEMHGKISGNFTQWQTATPMPDGSGARYRHRANGIRTAAARQGFPNIFVANNEYGGGNSDDHYKTSLIRTEQLLEMFIGNYDMSAYWNITFMLGESNSRLRAIQHSWEMMGNAHEATMLNLSNNGSHVPGFAAKTDEDIQLFLLNKNSTAEALNVDFTGLFQIKTDGSHSGSSMVDTADHYGEVQPLDLTLAGGTFSGTLPALSFSRIVFPLVSSGDTTPPATPTGLTASYLNGKMTLDWDDNGEGDLHEYRLYRSTVSGRDFRLRDMNVSTSSFIDTTAVNGVDYYYRVEAVDTSGNASAPSSQTVGLMPAYESVFQADFELSNPRENSTAANLNLGTIGGQWAGLAGNTHLRRDRPPEPGRLHIISQAMLVDKEPNGFALRAILDNAVPVDGTEVAFDMKMRRFGNTAKNVTIEGRDASGNTSFELLLRMTDRRICYVHSGSTVVPFPEGEAGELDYNGDTYDPPLDKIRIIMTPTGYRVEFKHGEWISSEVPFNGTPTTINRVFMTASTSQAGVWIDNLKVRRLLPPDDGSNVAPVFNADPILAPAATHGESYALNLPVRASDANNDVLTFSRVAGPAWLSIRSDGKVRGTPGIGDIGIYTYRVKVADPYGASHIVDMQLEVERGLNNPPIFTNDVFFRAAATEEVAYLNSIAGLASDPDTIDTLTFFKLGGPAWLSIASNGEISGTPTSADIGLNQFTVEVSDGNGGSDTAVLRVQVEESSVLAAWHQFAAPGAVAQSPQETNLPTISGSLVYSNNGGSWNRGDGNEGSADLTYGTVVGAPGNTNTPKDALRTKITGRFLEITITNNHPSSHLHLKKFSFDAWRRYQGSIRSWTLQTRPGSGITSGTSWNGTFDNHGGAPSDSDFDDFDFDLTALDDNILATGESATMRLTMGVTSGSGDVFLDNLAFSGSLELLPEIGVAISGEANLFDGNSEVEFGEALGSGAAITVPLTIRNTGEEVLTDIAASLSGADAGDFDIGEIETTSLEPSESTTMTVTFSAPTAGIKSAALKITSNDLDENPFNLALSGTKIDETTLESWAEGFGLTEGALLPNSDDDGDFVTLLEEYAFGLDPTVKDRYVLAPATGIAGVPLIRVVGEGNNKHLQSEFVRRRSDPDLSYVVEYSTDLSEIPLNGFAPATEPQQVTDIDANFQRVIVDDSATFQTHDRRFGRVIVDYQNTD